MGARRPWPDGAAASSDRLDARRGYAGGGIQPRTSCPGTVRVEGTGADRRTMRVMTLVLRSAVQSRHILLGGMVVFCIFQILLIAHAAEIERSQAFGRVAELMPGFLQRGLGAQAMQLATFKGSVSFGYFHPVI